MITVVGGRTAPSALPPMSTLPPASTASWTQRSVRCALARSTIGPTCVSGSSGSPTLRSRAPSTKRAMNSSQTDSCTNRRCTLMHTWPA